MTAALEEHLEDGEDLDRQRHGPAGYQQRGAGIRCAVAEDARMRIQHLLVTGDNRLKQGVAPAKVRES